MNHKTLLLYIIVYNRQKKETESLDVYFSLLHIFITLHLQNNPNNHISQFTILKDIPYLSQ